MSLSANTFKGGRITSTNPDLTARTILVTGANRGIGLATALGLARRGARTILICRSQAKADDAAAFVSKESGNTRIHPITADLASLASIRSACELIRQRVDSLNILINNAAVITPKREESVNGFELQFAVNHLAPFAMTGLLLDLLLRSAPSRVITVSSASHRRTSIDIDDLQFSRRAYNRVTAYAQSKLANILFTEELARRLDPTQVTANCLHPGVVDTGLLQDYSGTPHAFSFAMKVFKGTERGAQTSIYLASSQEVAGVSGKYFDDCRPIAPDTATSDETIAVRLWQESERLTGVTYPRPTIA